VKTFQKEKVLGLKMKKKVVICLKRCHITVCLADFKIKLKVLSMRPLQGERKEDALGIENIFCLKS